MRRELTLCACMKVQGQDRSTIEWCFYFSCSYRLPGVAHNCSDDSSAKLNDDSKETTDCGFNDITPACMLQTAGMSMSSIPRRYTQISQSLPQLVKVEEVTRTRSHLFHRSSNTVNLGSTGEILRTCEQGPAIQRQPSFEPIACRYNAFT